MQVTKCQNRFEVIADRITEKEANRLIEEFQNWLLEREARGFDFEWPGEEDYMAALGPCGK